ncbi:MAG: acyl carrier protein [Myxococcota bacterium]
MQQQQVIEILREYIAREVLDGKDIGLEASTPLLEWGVLNSFEITRLISFMTGRFGVTVPSNKAVGTHFQDLRSLSSLIIDLTQQRPR